MEGGVSLRRAMQLGVFILGGMLLVTGLVLAVITDLLERSSRELGESLESLRVSQGMQVELTTHIRSMVFAEGTGGYVPGVVPIELRLRRLLNEAGQHVNVGPAEQAQVDRVRAAIAAYLEAAHAAAATPASPRERLAAVGPSFNGAFDALDALVWLNTDAARRWRERATIYNEVANIISLVVIALAALAVIALLRGLSGQLLRPLSDLHRAVVDFAGGDEASRAPVRGVREVRELARTFDETADALVRFRHGHTAFQLGLAQELRDPLTVIKLRLRAPPSCDPSATRQAVEEQVQRMDRILRDVIDAALIGAGKLEIAPERRDLRPLVEKVAGEFRALAPDRPIEVRAPQAPVEARCDAARVEHVLRNLMSNALKYSAPESPVLVELGAEGDRATIAVTDHGIGIRPEELPRLFEPFHRTGVSGGYVSGAGLGLAATKRIVEAHGGAITVESEAGRGSIFRVSLPVTEPRDDGDAARGA